MSRKITLDDLSVATDEAAAETRRYAASIDKLRLDILAVLDDLYPMDEEGDNAMQRGPSGDDGAEGGER